MGNAARLVMVALFAAGVGCFAAAREGDKKVWNITKYLHGTTAEVRDQINGETERVMARRAEKLADLKQAEQLADALANRLRDDVKKMPEYRKLEAERDAAEAGLKKARTAGNVSVQMDWSAKFNRSRAALVKLDLDALSQSHEWVAMNQRCKDLQASVDGLSEAVSKSTKWRQELIDALRIGFGIRGPLAIGTEGIISEVRCFRKLSDTAAYLNAEVQWGELQRTGGEREGLDLVTFQLHHVTLLANGFDLSKITVGQTFNLDRNVIVAAVRVEADGDEVYTIRLAPSDTDDLMQAVMPLRDKPPAGKKASPATTLEKPVHIEVTLTEKMQKVAGDLIRYDANMICIKNTSGEHELQWSQLILASQHAVRARIVNRGSAVEMLQLAELAMKCNLREQAKLDVAAAVQIDPAAQLKGDAILRSGPGSKWQMDKYKKSTPEEDAKAIELAKSLAAETAKLLKIKLAEVQTPHFIIFTNWDPAQYDFLKTNCEAAYSAVSKQFDIPVQQNVFVGKLPIYMFKTHGEFQTCAKTIDQFPVRDTVAGYYMPHQDGSGHMAMWKPDIKQNRDAAEINWARTLTHEFTHAFMARYRSNQSVPRWLNEGLAEVVAVNQFPHPIYNYVHAMAGRKFDFQTLFDDKVMPTGEMYPVMQTMVEYLMHLDRAEFHRYLNDLKDGMDPDEALMKHFQQDHRSFEMHWRGYAERLED